MNITTYENTVKKGTIKAHGRSDGLREMLEQLSEMQKIVIAPMSVDTPEQDGDKAPETVAADQVVGRAKSTAGAVRDAVTLCERVKINPLNEACNRWRRTLRGGRHRVQEIRCRHRIKLRLRLRIEAPPKQCHIRYAPVRKLHSR